MPHRKRRPEAIEDDGLVIGYLRVSTEEQADSRAGLEAQRQTIAAEAARRGWTVRWVEDAGYSAKNLRRPGIENALNDLARARATALVVAKLDRLSRSVADFAGLLDVSRREDWGLVALDLGVDTTSPAGELIANVMASVAQWERRAIGQRTKEALAQKRAQGVRLGRPRSVPVEVRNRIRKMRRSGASLASIAHELNEEHIPTGQGGKSWYPSTIRAVLATA